MRIKLIVISALLASCSSMSMPKLTLLTPHKIEIRQGNLITPEMREKLKIGMTRLQVRAALGTPLVNDPFHANQWDYVYRLEQEGVLVEQQRLTLYFDGDRLVRIDDGGKPSVSVPQTQAPQSVEAASIVAEATPTKIEAVLPVPVEKPKPAPKVEPRIEAPRTVVVRAEQAVGDAVKGWAEAWAAHGVAKYLSFYAKDFKPADGLSHASWEAQRKDRIGKAKNIKVELSDIKVSVQGGSRASVSFKQSYRADNYKDVTHKILELEKVGDAWLIVSEQAAKK